MGILEAILLAFIGGAILNLMPCVLPVLAIKVTALARSGAESPRVRMTHGLGYAAGILTTMLTLAAVVIALKSTGQMVGWGFQFQHPLFVAALTGVMILFALNLFGVFEIGVPSAAGKLGLPQGSGARRSFFEGILAVVLATPCTAPFMGAAIGFAMTGDPVLIIAVFASLGAGLAAPFVAVAFVPGFQRLLPKPGNWMNTMKTVLGFALLGTALWLVWLFGRLTDLDGIIALLGVMMALSFAAWVYGELQYKSLNWTKVATLATVFLAVGAGTVYVLAGVQTPQANASETQAVSTEPLDPASLEYQPWSEARVANALAEGRPVFVNFTADWCISCKVNERTVISTDDVMAQAARSRMVMLKADLTNPVDELVAKIEEFGRSGVPLYLVYSPDRPNEPSILPQVLTKDTLIEAFAGAAGLKR